MSEPVEREPVAPHPWLSEFYGERDEHAAFVRRLFNETASFYDGINKLYSLGSGAWYRRRCLVRAGLHPGQRLIDVATGTGMVAQEAVAVTGSRQDVIGIDLSEAMLAIARNKLDIAVIQGVAEQLPVADASADFVTMGYALRHVCDLVTAFREFHRVLREDGTVLLLEIGKPTRRLGRVVAQTYLGRLVPLLSRWLSGSERAQALTQYYWATIDQCVAPEVILKALGDSGFVELACDVELDMMRCYVGRKRSPATITAAKPGHDRLHVSRFGETLREIAGPRADTLR
jgi:demethylmenaquinone methyltransferase/2-methoxy-6-polyprenyl-1,4-benzoquinol methylase